ncbi:MAG: hypothetical protein P9M15_04850 [Candidatus Electryoneaceae bacterium]|nr:hypothetical protein [Candidatus Electryoneaceae bacterium]
MVINEIKAKLEEAGDLSPQSSPKPPKPPLPKTGDSIESKGPPQQSHDPTPSDPVDPDPPDSEEQISQPDHAKRKLTFWEKVHRLLKKSGSE